MSQEEEEFSGVFDKSFCFVVLFTRVTFGAALEEEEEGVRLGGQAGQGKREVDCGKGRGTSNKMILLNTRTKQATNKRTNER